FLFCGFRVSVCMWGGSLIHLLLVVGLVVLVINLLSGRRSAVSKKGTTSPSTRRSRCSLPPASGPFQPHARSARGALPPNCRQNVTGQLINVLEQLRCFMGCENRLN